MSYSIGSVPPLYRSTSQVGVEGDGASGHRHVASDWDREAGGMPRSRGCGGGTPPVVRRLVDPKSFTGTAATGHLPITVDLEKGVDVSRTVFWALLKKVQ